MARVRLGTGQKFRLIDQLPYSKSSLCTIAGVSRSGYYAWKKHDYKRVQREQEDLELAGVIEVLCGEKIGTYGYRRVTMKLHEHGYIVNHKAVARVMYLHNLQAGIRRTNPYKQIMKKTQEHLTCPNLLNRNFSQTKPECVAGTDITYLWVPILKRFVYLSVVKDFASGEILAHITSLSLTMPIVLRTIAMLSKRLGSHTKGFMLHSDQGVHYTYPGYQKTLSNLRIVQSMSRKGNCIDNASTESFFGHMKDELDVSYCKSFHEVQIAIATHISYHNTKRRQWDKNKMTPVEYRDHLFSLAS